MLSIRPVRLTITIALVLAVSPLVGVHSAFAVPGDADPSFGQNGVVVTDLTHPQGGPSDEAHDVAVQADGRIVTFGVTRQPSQFVAVRYLDSGTLDASFGSNGVFEGSYGQYTRNDLNVGAIQPDGALLLGGQLGGTDFALMRLTPNGVLDPTFSSDGKFSASPTGRDSVQALVLQEDGKILLAGSTCGADDCLQNGIEDVGVMRLLPDGRLDETFGSGGFQQLGFDEQSVGVHGMAIEPDGRVVIGGVMAGRSFLARIFPNGSLDASFGDQGLADLPFEAGSAWVEALAVQRNGSIVVGGGRPSGESFLARLESDGRPDTSFGTAGLVSEAERFGPTDIVIQSDGRIVVSAAEWGSPCSAYGPVVVRRYEVQGDRDVSFGANGQGSAWPPQPCSVGVVSGVALAPDGKIVAAGTTYAGDDLVAARFLGGGSASPTDLSVHETDTPDPVREGEEVRYDVVVQNVGATTASGIVLTDTYASGAEFRSASTAQGSCSTPFAGKVDCFLGSLSPGASATVSIRVSYAHGATYANSVSVTANEADATPSSNEATEQTTVKPKDPDPGPDPVPACTIIGTPGKDRLVGTAGRDVICADAGLDVVDGKGGDDILRGGEGDDVLVGGNGADTLLGQGGDDVLVGVDLVSGNDRLVGGDGNDRCKRDIGDSADC